MSKNESILPSVRCVNELKLFFKNSRLSSSIVFMESPCLILNAFNSSSINARSRSSGIGSFRTNNQFINQTNKQRNHSFYLDLEIPSDMNEVEHNSNRFSSFV